jgi:RimJ/RimL family protein N-acetyltransferase
VPLEGELVILREEREADVAPQVSWRNDMDTQAWNLALPPDYTEPMVRSRFESREFTFSRSDCRFVITLKGSGAAIGTISYTWLEPRFAASIGLITDKSVWGTGAALDAQEVLLRFMFLELGVRVVRLWTTSANPRAVGLASKSGFQVSMRRREAAYKGGRLCDSLGLDLLRAEYFELHPGLVDELPPGSLQS